MNLADASKIEIDSVLQACGWRQTKQRVILLKSIFDGNDKHFSISQINETLKDNRSYFSLTTLYENLNTLVIRDI
jgi:Fe2+ or Zn2+ uptake regulation protein